MNTSLRSPKTTFIRFKIQDGFPYFKMFVKVNNYQHLWTRKPCVMPMKIYVF